MFWINFVFLFNVFLLNSTLSSDITNQVFGTDYEFLPAAFGDFNSDELTDLFVLRNNSKTIEVLLGSNEGGSLLKAANLKCMFEKCNIAGVVPGDFNGDALMDVLVMAKCSNKNKAMEIYLLWGSQDKLNCSYDERTPIITAHGEPLALDFNNDFIIDLFGVRNDDQRGFWLFNNNSTPIFQPFNFSKDYKIKDPHSNAYLDLNNDNIADLFLTVQKDESFSFEEWHGTYKDPLPFFFNRRIFFPFQVRHKLGQSLFLDLELEGKLDHIVPVLDKKLPKLFVYANEKWRDLNVNFKEGETTWYFYDGGLPFSKIVTLRGGDYNMDGYPDLLATLTTGQINRTFLFENVPCNSGCDNFTRSFKIQWNGFSKDMNDTVGGIFYDIFQDGILDAIVIRKFINGSYYVSAIKNNLDYDTNFIKVMVVTGLTNKNEYKSDGPLRRRKTAFGTNLPGPRVAYQTVDQDGFIRTGVSVQLPQSAHYSLNLPYIMFALGRTPNFVDNITVGFASKHRDLPQVIPNSQMVVIPKPIENPTKWKVQLFVTPSKIIVLSATALIGTCILLVIVILILHWKEKKTDRFERLQEAHRFNFDAM